jgi:hypothetical protein
MDLRKTDFVVVPDGETFNPFGKGFFPPLQLERLAVTTPGVYTFRFSYATSDRVEDYLGDARPPAGLSGIYDPVTPEIRRLFERVPKLELKSNELKLRFTAKRNVLTNPVDYAQWFLEHSGPAISFGVAAAFLLSRFGGLSLTAQSRCALSFSIVIAAFMGVQPHFSDMPPGSELPAAVAAAFGLAFAIVRLRICHGRSVAGWLCGALHALVILGALQELSHFWSAPGLN